MNEIKEVLNYFRMLPKYKGYSYLEDAIQLCREHSEYLTQITKVVYPELAKKYHVTPWSVERNIRTIIDKSWQMDRRLCEGQESRYNKFFEYNVIIRPSNAAFISMVVVRLEENQGLLQGKG